jgi:hypothetical protein
MRVLPQSCVVVMLLDCSREFYKAVVGYTDALRGGGQCRSCFHCKKKPGALENLDHSSNRATRAVNPDRIRPVSAFASRTVQICQRHFMKAIIPFIPLTADLKNGHEESVN